MTKSVRRLESIDRILKEVSASDQVPAHLKARVQNEYRHVDEVIRLLKKLDREATAAKLA